MAPTLSAHPTHLVRRNPLLMNLHRRFDPGRWVVDPHNRRLKIFEIKPQRLAEIGMPHLPSGRILDPRSVSKITAYSRIGYAAGWRELGFRREGTIAGFFRDGSEAALWAFYPDPVRAHDPAEEEHRRIVALARGKCPREPHVPKGFREIIVHETHAEDVAHVLQHVFSDYPSPISPEAVASSIRHCHSHFRMLVDEHGQPAAVASAELDLKRHSAEMTDCATLPEHRGKGLMAWLLFRLEQDLPDLFGITDLFTIARANEPGINLPSPALATRSPADWSTTAACPRGGNR
jgi:beta-lysine N6-acetyltransferase